MYFACNCIMCFMQNSRIYKFIGFAASIAFVRLWSCVSLFCSCICAFLVGFQLKKFKQVKVMHLKRPTNTKLTIKLSTKTTTNTNVEKIEKIKLVANWNEANSVETEFYHLSIKWFVHSLFSNFYVDFLVVIFRCWKTFSLKTFQHE